MDPTLIADNVVAVTSEVGQLFAQETGQPKIALTPQEDGFGVAGLNLHYRFEGSDAAPATALVIERDGASVQAVRSNEEEATAAQAAFAREAADQARPASDLLSRRIPSRRTSAGTAFRLA